jgi:hypothetical protein
MFGYLTINADALEETEKARYLQAYCGVCHALRERSGQLSRLALSHDLTFMSLMHMSLYEPPEVIAQAACPVHPVKKRAYTANRMVDYAADMTVALMYFKCLDDWNDDENRPARTFAHSLEPHYREVKQRWPRQCSTIERGLDEITHIEQAWKAKRAGANADGANPGPSSLAEAPDSNGADHGRKATDKTPGSERTLDPGLDLGCGDSPSPDAAANCFGTIMAEIFVMEEDVWSDTLREFGFYLGRFVYLMDAAVDLSDDLKSGSYNPFAPTEDGLEPLSEQGLRAILGIDIARAAAAFERLPLVQDVHLLRSVLYSGVWARFNRAYEPNASTSGDAEAATPTDVEATVPVRASISDSAVTSAPASAGASTSSGAEAPVFADAEASAPAAPQAVEGGWSAR